MRSIRGCVRAWDGLADADVDMASAVKSDDHVTTGRVADC